MLAKDSRSYKHNWVSDGFSDIASAIFVSFGRNYDVSILSFINLRGKFWKITRERYSAQTWNLQKLFIYLSSKNVLEIRSFCSSMVSNLLFDCVTVKTRNKPSECNGHTTHLHWFFVLICTYIAWLMSRYRITHFFFQQERWWNFLSFSSPWNLKNALITVFLILFFFFFVTVNCKRFTRWFTSVKCNIRGNNLICAKGLHAIYFLCRRYRKRGRDNKFQVL